MRIRTKEFQGMWITFGQRFSFIGCEPWPKLSISKNWTEKKIPRAPTHIAFVWRKNVSDSMPFHLSLSIFDSVVCLCVCSSVAISPKYLPNRSLCEGARIDENQYLNDRNRCVVMSQRNQCENLFAARRTTIAFDSKSPTDANTVRAKWNEFDALGN